MMIYGNWQAEYKNSIENNIDFWAEESKRIDWIKPWKSVTSGSFEQGNVKWFEEGSLNVCYNCVDRHLESNADKTAIIWESDDPNQSTSITYRELHKRVSKFANVLKSMGIKKGDIVCIYMPMIAEAAIAMLACARIGAVHSVVFGGFSPDSIKDRILDAQCKYVITADGGVRGGKAIPLKNNVDTAVAQCPCVEKVLVIKHAKNDTHWEAGRDICFNEAIAQASDDCPIEEMNAEDPLFILYTSGSTGKPKGVVHTTGGYLVYTSLTHEKVFDLQENDIYWCTADVGWITGHSYLVYGPLANGTTTLMYEGVPNYPSQSRFFEVVDKHKVSIFYTAPTAIRALIAQGDAALGNTSRKSLRVLGTVGEPINEEAWEWYFKEVGNLNCPITDTWWQTETGGIMIAPCVASPQKPCSAMHSLLGISAAILDKNTAQEILGSLERKDYGALAIKHPWPGMMRTIYGDHDRYMDAYFKPYPGYYFPADGAFRDEDGDYWITGRLDDVISIAGHRIGTAEIESAIDSHPSIAEAAIVGIPDEIKGETIYAFISLNKGNTPSDDLKKDVITWVRKTYGPIASITAIQWAPLLPKTRSGKIMRRVLRKIAHFEEHQIGDTSTLADDSCVTDLIENRIDYR
jgi:acetyl-CoA synthetase